MGWEEEAWKTQDQAWEEDDTDEPVVHQRPAKAVLTTVGCATSTERPIPETRASAAFQSTVSGTFLIYEGDHLDQKVGRLEV